MLKWILGIAGVLVVGLAATCYMGYKKLTEGGDTSAVTIAGGADRIFAALATPDSMVQWMPDGNTITPLGQGMLKVGDTLFVEGKVSEQGASKQRVLWVVQEVAAPTKLVLGMAMDTVVDGKRRMMAVRTDSLVTAGDSTTIVSTFTSDLMAEARSKASDTSKVGGAVVGVAEKVMISAFRLMHESELKRLKARVEGKP